ncbi:MAG TPA: ATPase [Bacillota bacterium]|jgi:hypothetical protein
MKSGEHKTEFETLLDALEAGLTEAKRVPLTDFVMVREDLILDALDHLRRIFPDEMQKSQWIIRDRDKILADARGVAEKTVLDAQARAGQLTSQDEVTRLAQARATEIMAEAQRRATELKDGAEAYAADVLARFDGELQKVMEAVRNGRERLGTRARQPNQQKGRPV